MTDFDKASIAAVSPCVNFKGNFSWRHMFTLVGLYGNVRYIWIETNTAYMNFNILHVPLLFNVV